MNGDTKMHWHWHWHMYTMCAQYGHFRHRTPPHSVFNSFHFNVIPLTSFTQRTESSTETENEKKERQTRIMVYRAGMVKWGRPRGLGGGKVRQRDESRKQTITSHHEFDIKPNEQKAGLMAESYLKYGRDSVQMGDRYNGRCVIYLSLPSTLWTGKVGSSLRYKWSGPIHIAYASNWHWTPAPMHTETWTKADGINGLAYCTCTHICDTSNRWHNKNLTNNQPSVFWTVFASFVGFCYRLICCLY